MIQHVYERAARARRVDRVLVATDDDRVAAAVRAFGGDVVMTSSRHTSGTDRIAEAVRDIDTDIIVNVQGDEPLLDPALVDAAVQPLAEEPGVVMSTVSLPIRQVEEMLSPAVVKVVTDARGDALYFSRSPLPHVRDGADSTDGAARAIAAGLARRHVGLYVYRRETLMRFAALPPSPLERAESLEQLRVLQDGTRIRVVPFEGEATPAVDTPEDLERVRTLLGPASRHTA